ncbi:MAG TPA: hypothetical protein ENI20_00175 [Bacteroides sp.]|nr:hypothetical protein [Bacteroides sp.]
MKRFIGLILPAILIFNACENDDYFIQPKADFTLQPESASVLDLITLQITGGGQYFTFFTGDEGHNYDSLSAGDIGLSPNPQGELIHSYRKPGTYNIVLIATGYDHRDGKTVRDTYEKSISISENRNTIEKMDFGTLGAYFSGANDFLDFSQEGAIYQDEGIVKVYLYQYARIFNLSTKLPYTGASEIPVIPIITLDSEVAVVTVDGSQVGNGEYVNHVDESGNLIPKTYLVTADDGSKREYDVGLMFIPEFKTFTIAGKTVSTENIADHMTNYLVDPLTYHKFYIELTVDHVTDLSNLAADFSLWDDSIEVMVDNVPQESGVSTNDFTNPLTYHLLYKQPGSEEIFQSKSEIIVTLSK